MSEAFGCTRYDIDTYVLDPVTGHGLYVGDDVPSPSYRTLPRTPSHSRVSVASVGA